VRCATGDRDSNDCQSKLPNQSSRRPTATKVTLERACRDLFEDTGLESYHPLHDRMRYDMHDACMVPVLQESHAQDRLLDFAMHVDWAPMGIKSIAQPFQKR
jgi:hypothetical protein